MEMISSEQQLLNTPLKITDKEIEEYEKCVNDPVYFLNKYWHNLRFEEKVTLEQFNIAVNEYQAKKLTASISAMGSEVSTSTAFN